jgi:hypothetical protein
VRRSERARTLVERKLFYLFTCEYCFSHYVAGGAVLLTGYRLLLPDWRGALIAWLSLVWVANFYMSLFGRLRLDIKRERVEIKAEEVELEKEEAAASTPGPNGRARRSAA